MIRYALTRRYNGLEPPMMLGETLAYNACLLARFHLPSGNRQPALAQACPWGQTPVGSTAAAAEPEQQAAGGAGAGVAVVVVVCTSALLAADSMLNGRNAYSLQQ